MYKVDLYANELRPVVVIVSIFMRGISLFAYPQRACYARRRIRIVVLTRDIGGLIHPCRGNILDAIPFTQHSLRRGTGFANGWVP